jgi:hypothetical protein
MKQDTAVSFNGSISKMKRKYENKGEGFTPSPFVFIDRKLIEMNRISYKG